MKQEERRRAFKLFSPEKQVILDTLAFGRRAPARRKMTQDTQRGTVTIPIMFKPKLLQLFVKVVSAENDPPPKKILAHTV